MPMSSFAQHHVERERPPDLETKIPSPRQPRITRIVVGKLPDGWERSETTNGIPYYINHETERTQWDHPEMVSLMEEIESLSNIKYAAYRTAMKLRAIQKKTQLYMVDLQVIKESLRQEGIENGYAEGNLSVRELTENIANIFDNQNQSGSRDGSIDISLASELVLNWILNVYDPGRTGSVPVLSLKVALCVMCSEKVQEKYTYLFSQFCNRQRYLDRNRLKLFLQEMLQIPKYIYESTSFSGSSVEPAVRNCFERVSIPERVSAEEFLEWMIAEPQTIVWLPTLHRLAVSETVKHESKCNVCKMYPIVGFRYRCLKCFNFDLCQGCFWSGRVNKQHKIGHPTQEYCLVSTQKEDMKDFAKVMRNKVSKKKKKTPEHPSKGRFIPIEMEDAAPSDGEDDGDSVDASSPMNVFPGTHNKLGSYAARLADHETKEDKEVIKEQPVLAGPDMEDGRRPIRHFPKSLADRPESASPSTTQVDRAMDSQEKRDLEDLITSLENDNRALQGEINNIQHLQRQKQKEHSVVPYEDPAREAFLRQQRERLEAREEVLEEHNYQLQVQLHRLRILLHQEENTLSGLIRDEEKMAAKLARERMVQICKDANFKPYTGDASHLSPPMKSAAVQSSSKPYTGQSTADSTAMAPLTSSQPISGMGSSTVNASGGTHPSSSRVPGISPTYPPVRPTTIAQTTYLSPGPSIQAYPPPHSLSPGLSPPWRDPYPQSQRGAVRGASPSGLFTPKTAAELGLLDRPDTLYEGMELSNIVDRMTSAFPLDVHSDMPVDVHNDLFLSASLIGEAMQSMVTTVSRKTGSRKGALEPGRTSKRESVEPNNYGQDNSVYGEWSREDPDAGNRLSLHSIDGYEYGPL